MSLAQIGEFSFIIAVLGARLGATGDFLYPVTVGVSVVTSLATPWLIRAAGPAASYVDRKLPRPLQTFATLYGAWLERLAASPDAQAATRGPGRGAARARHVRARRPRRGRGRGARAGRGGDRRARRTRRPRPCAPC